MTRTQTGFHNALKKVPQTFSPDGLLRFGDKIMLSNKKTDACMVADADKKLHAYEECYAVTSSPHITGPISRAIFVIERAWSWRETNFVRLWNLLIGLLGCGVCGCINSHIEHHNYISQIHQYEHKSSPILNNPPISYISLVKYFDNKFLY